MSSAKQTDSQGEKRDPGQPRPIQSGPTVQAKLVVTIVVGTILLGGWAAVLVVNRWHLTSGVVFLLAGWASIILVANYLWRAGWSAAGETSAISDEEFWRPAGRREELDAEKRALLKAIKEIEFDHGMGKMSDQDAEELTRYYRARAIDVIKALDTEGGPDDDDLSVAELIERDVKLRLKLKTKKPARKVAPSTDTTASESADSKSSDADSDSDSDADPDADAESDADPDADADADADPDPDAGKEARP